MKTKMNLFKLILASISLCVIGIEIASVVIHYMRFDELFYIRNTIEEPAPTRLLEDEPSADFLTDMRFHPYFGYIRRPGVSLLEVVPGPPRLWFDLAFKRGQTPAWVNITTNNYGFFSWHDYPYERQGQDQVIIGVFGGSVAERWSRQGADILKTRLQTLPLFRDKEIVILNFGGGGLKQPQQLLILNYFLSIGQAFDIVINIDGFNEVALSAVNHRNNIDISMPTSQTIQPIQLLGKEVIIGRQLVNIGQVKSLATIAHLKERMRWTDDQIKNTHFAAIFFLLPYYKAYLSSNLSRELDTLKEKSSEVDSLIYLNLARTFGSGAELHSEVAQIWARASLLMANILENRNIDYFHFLQPNQYASGKVFGLEESRIALNDEISYKEDIKKGYPYIIANIKKLKRSGVEIYDSTFIFDDELRVVYSDNCCHYNQWGNDLLAEFIAEAMLVSLSSRSDERP